MSPIAPGMNILNPLRMEREDEWALIAGYSGAEEYDTLDNLFRYLTGDILKRELPVDMRSKPEKELRELYEKRFAVLYGKVLQEIDKEPDGGGMALGMDYYIPQVEH